MTDWESCYLEGTTPWDKGAPSPPLSAWLQSHDLKTGRALVPGCGVGHDVIRLRAAGLDAIGVDLSPTAIQRAAQTYPEQAQHFHLSDLFALPSSWDSSFDYIFEHTCLCALPPDLRGAYEKTAHQLLKPGAQLVGVWFINPDMDPGESGPPFAISLADLSELFPPSRWEVKEDFTPAAAYEGRAGRERLRVLQKKS